MSTITFNNVPLEMRTVRTPGVYSEVDNSRALGDNVENPHKVLIIGQKTASGTSDLDTLKKITTENIADGYFGARSILGRMCKKFKQANPYTECYAIALSEATAAVASGAISFSVALSHHAGIVSVDNETVNLMINGTQLPVTLTALWSVTDVNSAVVAKINASPYLPLTASTNAASAILLTAACAGSLGNEIKTQFNFYEGQNYPTCFGDSALVTAMADGANNPDIADAWAVIDNEQFHHIISAYSDEDNFDALHTELETRFGPLIDQQGHGYIALNATNAALITYGDDKNSAFISVLGYDDGPQTAEEWAAVLGAECSLYLNLDPARPLQTLELPGIIAPKTADLFSRDERDLLLRDGISTWIQGTSGAVVIERIITTYQVNDLDLPDASYLNIQTLATLSEIRYQYKLRMYTRFISERFKLADDTFPVQPGQYIATPKTIKQEIIALFSELRDAGLVENIDDFADNMIVERDTTDKDRVNVLLPPDLVNQFRILATVVQFIL